MKNRTKNCPMKFSIQKKFWCSAKKETGDAKVKRSDFNGEK